MIAIKLQNYEYSVSYSFFKKKHNWEMDMLFF